MFMVSSSVDTSNNYINSIQLVLLKDISVSINGASPVIKVFCSSLLQSILELSEEKNLVQKG